METTTSNEGQRGERLLSAAQVAARLNVSKGYAYRMLRERKMPVVMVGDLPRVIERDLSKFIASKREAR
jgi:excisionase family DNA binding protein